VEFISSELQIGAIALFIGILIGVLAYRLLGRSTRESEKIVGELDAAKAELSEYKANVNQHFHQTSELVNELTQNYVKVYQHLAEGAQSLGDSQGFDNLLEHQKGKVAIAVDESFETVAQAPDPVLQPEVTAEHIAQDIAKDIVDISGDEHAAPFGGQSTAAASAEKAEASGAAYTSAQPVKAETEPDPAAAEAATSDKKPEAVLNVDALGEAIDKSEPDTAQVVSATPDGNEKPESRPTTH
jgi:uncharacterized membrane-anchored protein YhcB (DUF1043 family)